MGKCFVKFKAQYKFSFPLLELILLWWSFAISRCRWKRYLFYLTYTPKVAARRVKSLGVSTGSRERTVLELALWGSHPSERRLGPPTPADV